MPQDAHVYQFVKIHKKQAPPWLHKTVIIEESGHTEHATQLEPKLAGLTASGNARLTHGLFGS
jgi:hypothetical protein